MERETKWMRGALNALLMGTLLAGVAACDDEDDPLEPSENIVELAASNMDLETLVTAVEAAGLDSDLSGEGPFTVFAPADAAFGAVPADVLSALLESGNADVLQELLLGHVVSGAVLSSDLSDGQTVTTLSGDELTVSIDGSEIRIGGALVQTANVQASNGVVHIIDGVLTQGLNVVERARITPELSSLVTAVSNAGLASALEGDGPFTVFAPTNTAFDAIAPVPTDPTTLQPILLYHVVGQAALSSTLSDGQTLTTLQGGEVTVQIASEVAIQGAQNTANVAVTDIRVSNGVIHVIDTVLLPPSN
ncbi:MAG: fasciclin domain-containing protein [Candidatus Longimicrobiales bacterium M2_2A_002]